MFLYAQLDYLPYLTFAYNIAHPRDNVRAFQIMTEGKPKATPYDSHKATPKTKNKLKVRLISCALLSLNRRHTCGTYPPVVNAPPINPNSSFQSKLISHLLVLLTDYTPSATFYRTLQYSDYYTLDPRDANCLFVGKPWLSASMCDTVSRLC